MPRYLLAESQNDGLSYSGIVTGKTTWKEDADGRRQRSEDQEVDVNGVPLWLVSTTRLTESFGRLSEVVADVTVPSLTKPHCPRHTPAKFDGLAVDVRVNRTTGQLVESFSATGIADND